MSHGNWPADLKSMRTRHWSEEVMKAVGCTSQQQFVQALNRPGSKLVSLGGLPWSEYFSGRRSPKNTNIQLAEAVVPGTAEVYDANSGPRGLPLWPLLLGKGSASEDMLNVALTAHYGQRWRIGADLEKMAWAFICMLLPAELAGFEDVVEGKRKFIKMVDMDVFYGNPDNDFAVTYVLTFNRDKPHETHQEELVEENFLKEDMVKIHYVPSFGEWNCIDYGFEYWRNQDKCDLQFSYETILGAFGLYNIAVSAKNQLVVDLAKYILDGLSRRYFEYELSDLGYDLKVFTGKNILQSLTK